MITLLSCAETERLLREDYPVLPGSAREFDSALRGAQKLGLVMVHGDAIARTTVGEAAGRLLPHLPVLAVVHKAVSPS